MLALQQGYSAAAVGILLALFALTQVFLALPAGLRGQAWFSKAVFPVHAGGQRGCALALALPLYPVLCLAALLTGGASGAVVIAVQRHAGRVTHDAVALKKVFSWLAIGPAISNFIGPFSTGLLIDHANFGGEGSTMGYRVAFGLLALVPVLAWSCATRRSCRPCVRP